MSIILGPNPAAPRSRNVVLSFSEWDAATWTAAPNPLAGAPTANLVTRQPVQVAGYDLSAPGEVLQLDGVFTTRQPVDVVSIPYATATPEATWRVQVGDSTVDFDGVQVADASGNANPGQRHGATAFVAGKYEGGLALGNADHADDYLASPSLPAEEFGTTYMLWVNPTRLGDEQAVLSHGSGGDRHVGAILADGRVRIGPDFDPISGTNTSASPVVVPGSWTHLAFVFQTVDNVELYADGVLVASGEVASLLVSGSHPVCFGGSSEDALGVAGVLDDCRQYLRALSEAEIQAEMQSETPTVTDGSLVFQYRLNAYDSGPLTFGAPPNLASYARRAAYLLLPYRMTNRRVRITIEDPWNAAFRIGRLMVGTCWQPSRNFDLGYRLGFLDDTKVSRTPTSQTTTNSRVPIPFVEFMIRHLQQDEILTNAYEIQRAYGSSQPVLVCLDPEDDRHLQRKLIYGLVSDLQPLSGPYHDLWEAGFRVEAML